VVCASQHGLFYPLRLGDEVNFRLTYDGPLKAASQSDTRRVEKHDMRCVFDRQLTELFGQHSALKAEFEDPKLSGTIQAIFGGRYKRGPFHCIPVVRQDLNLVCDLDILFLRRDNPGQLISTGGDLDNRLKVLFDALRVPQDDNEVRGFSAQDRHGLLVCLLEDDKLITGFRVTTDRLLEPATAEQSQNDVRLIINVEIKVTKLTPENMAYFSHF